MGKDDLIGRSLAWSQAIQHPLDRAYLKKIEGIPLLPKIIGWVVDAKRSEQEALFSGDGVLVTKASCPEAEEAFCEACKALNLDRADIRFFITANTKVNAFTTGSEFPTVVATSALVNAFSKDELVFVLGHELGHYICGHARCHTLARLLASAAWYTPAWIAGLSIEPLLMAWSRYSEISADRAGLLACKDFEAACGALLKLGGFPSQKGLPENRSKVLMDQLIDYERLLGGFSILRRLWREIKHGATATHPRVVERFAALDEWRDMGCYDELAEASLEERLKIAADVGSDYLKNELDLAIVEAAADYMESSGRLERKQALLLLRQAFMRGASLRGTALDSLVYAELVIENKSAGELSYNLALFFLDGANDPLKAVVQLDFTPDRDFAPQAIREKFIQTRQDRLSIIIYKPQN